MFRPTARKPSRGEVIHMRLKALTISFFASAMLVACGSSGPNIEQSKQDMNSPSGLTTDRNAIISAQGKQSTSRSSGFESAMSANPFAGASFGALRLQPQKSQPFARFRDAHPLNVLRPWFAHIEAQTGRKLQGLRANQDIPEFPEPDVDTDPAGFEACFDPNSVSYSGSPSPDGTGSFSAKIVVDYSLCESAFTGKQVLEASMESTATQFSITSRTELIQLCDGTSCMNGFTAVEMSGSGNLFSGLGTENASMFAAWDLKMITSTTRIHTKGAMRLTGNDFSTAEFMVYTRNSEGKEVSYVLREGNGMWSYRGADGEISCSYNGRAGSCSGGASTLEWTEDEALAIENDDAYRYYEETGEWDLEFGG